MIVPHRKAIISVDNKTGLVPFMTGLAETGWDMYASDGTQQYYTDATNHKIFNLIKLAEPFGEARVNKEDVAASISKLMRTTGMAHLVCVNLKTPHERIDEGGIAMLNAASNSGAWPVTNPEDYPMVLEELRKDPEDTQSFRHDLQMRAYGHIANHYDQAVELQS